MCGITAFFCRESVPDYKHLDTLFKHAENRGQDGCGLVLISKNDIGQRKIALNIHCPDPYSNPESKSAIKNALDGNLHIGDVVIFIARAAPETESNTDRNNIERTMQPIVSKEHGLVVVHNGAVSNFVYQDIKEKMKDRYQFKTDIDSEAILPAYLYHERNIKSTFEYLSGGFAAIMYDEDKDKIFVINDFKPIAHGYVRGLGFILHSDNEAIGEVIKDITACNRDGVNMWECYYHHYLSGGRVKEIDLDSGFIHNIKYSPRYVTQIWDSNNGVISNFHDDLKKSSIENTLAEEDNNLLVRFKNQTNLLNDEVCLVAASGGLDSTLTLATLKMAGYQNIHACHFRYGHRGQDSETAAITTICQKLGVTLKIFDIEQLMRSIDTTSMLIDPNAHITTGTKTGLKRLDAWVNMRNTQFMTWMSTYAESLVMKHDYKNVYFLGGFLNLSESGHYPDNSEYFLQTYLEHLKYGSLIGNRIKPLYCLSNIMKHELFVMIRDFNLIDIYKHTISCDRPIVVFKKEDPTKDLQNPDGTWNGKQVACNCSKDGLPACGSGLLSYWASKMVGLDDMKLRSFYEVQDANYKAHIPAHITNQFQKNPNINSIIDRILLPKDRLDELRKHIKQGTNAVSQ